MLIEYMLDAYFMNIKLAYNMLFSSGAWYAPLLSTFPAVLLLQKGQDQLQRRNNEL